MEITLNITNVTPHTVATIGGTGFGNVGAIALDNYIIIIDSSLYPKTGLIFREKLERKFNLPVKYLIFTHYHGDHIFGSQSYNDVTIISSRQTYDNIKLGYQNGWREDLEENDPLAEGKIIITKPTICFNKELIIGDDNNQVEISYAGGHTSGSSYIYFPAEKVLFTGDLIFLRTFPYGGDPTCDPDLWIDQLEKLKQIKADKFIPGHGPVFEDKQEIDMFIDLLKYVKKTVIKSIESNSDPNLDNLPSEYLDAAERRGPVTIENWTEFYKKRLESLIT
ncbi:MAG: MBL fold metallo-hydrolase [Candidatus Hodarchaeales archaeon]|jgi:glyoxylase-like metal-dependent hydrolase (beta-lactamase superfamily II)